MPEQSILDARLAEIDRRLRTIQSGLTPPEEAPPPAPPAPESIQEHEPEPHPAPPSPVPPAASRSLEHELAQAGQLVAELRQLTATHERLLASSRELLSTFADAIARNQPAPAPPAPDAPAAGSIALAAGPFADTGALRRFERSLATLPGVREVAVREYAGEDRVVIDVHLSGPKS